MRIQIKIDWDKYHSKTIPLNAANPYLDHLIDPSFQEVNRLFVLPFEANDSRIGHSRYYLPTPKVKGYIVMIDGKNIFDQPVKSYIKTFENIRKITTAPRDDYTTGCLLGYNYFKNYYNMIAIDLSKQQALDNDPKATQQIIFTKNLGGTNNRLMFFIIEEAKKTILELLKYCNFILFNTISI